MVLSVSNRDCLKIYDESARQNHFGCSQAWFAAEWQRRAGCGACVASNLVLYMTCRERSFRCFDKNECQKLMQRVWKHVTPTLRGIATTRLFCRRMFALAKAFDFSFEHEVLDFPKPKNRRPNDAQILAFFERAFARNVPVAFLNRCNGEEPALSRWHWVTVISVFMPVPGGDIFAEIADEGIIKTINFSLWSKSTKGGGGLVYFAPINA